MTGELEDPHYSLSFEVEVRLARWQPRPWWAWVLGSTLGGVLALLAGAGVLAGSDLGTSLRARACDASALPALALLALGAALLVAGFQLARLQYPEAVVLLEWRSLAAALPVPALLVAATLPGVLGCSLAADIADVGLVGQALVGAPGLLLAGVAAALFGAALAGTLQIAWSVPGIPSIDEPPGIVELAMEEADALERDAASQRFHGVDSE